MLQTNKIRKLDKKPAKKVVKPTTDNSTNIQVYLRCKNAGLKATTKENKHLKFIDADPVREVLLSSANVVYGFDRIFKEDTSQKQVFDHVAAPILHDVLKGYCCTIFAYGQTGTGKTYTMEGDTNDTGLGPKAGIIPRMIHNLFFQLGCINKDNHITVSMLELYNEELHDLLAIHENNPRQLSIYEDKDLGTRVKNLKEFPISTAAKGIELLKAGIKKRMTAATNYNKKSSRSHCIFTIHVYKKNSKPDGTEDYVVGRLNLVDLAGSENTKTAGSNQARAREAASINKSLLTLGRVITTLAEKAPHIPYRESKLTRLLKDSLGGNTKTCIIATVSPSLQQSDDLRSTLEYASKATQILNTPTGYLEIEHSLFEKNMADEFERLAADLRASHEKNGVYMAKPEFDKIMAECQLLKEEKAALEEEAAARSVQEEARVLALQQQHQEELLLMKQQWQAAKAEADRLAVVAKEYEQLCGLAQKVGSELNGFLTSRKRNRED